MSDGKKHDALNKFKDITGADEDRAKFYMESSNWDLDTALTNYLDDNEHELRNDSDSEEVPAASLQSHPSASTRTPQPDFDFKKPAPPRLNSDVKKPAPKPSGNVRTLSSLHQNQDSPESSDDEDGQAFYAGGSEHSGQQVLGPPRSRRTDIVTDVFRSVRQFGAEVVESQPSHSRGNSSRGAFSGTGYRLGETGNDSQVIASDDQSQVAITLKFWKNGFSVNDGPLRPFDDPENADFLHHIKHGEVPSELLTQAQGREISFNMEDYRHTEYVNTGPKVASFTGAGQKLGSVTPTLTSPTPASNSTDTTTNDEVQSNPVEVDKNKPTTSIQIRLADGSRLVGTFNHHHTVGDIRRFVNASSPRSRERNYILLSSFPRKELTKDDETIEGSGLINSVVMQHLVS